MADDPKVFLNGGVPLDVTDFQFTGESFSESNPGYIKGLRYLGPFTLTGRWLRANERICPNCDAIFVINEDQPFASMSDGTTETPICDRCAIALLSIDE